MLRPADRRKWLDIIGVVFVMAAAFVLYFSTRGCSRSSDPDAAPVIVAAPDTAARDVPAQKTTAPKSRRRAAPKESQKPRSRDFRHEEVPAGPPERK